MKELRLQTKIIESARYHGGHGRKWSSAFQVGMPDLVLTLPLYGVFLTEVKILNSGKNNTHDVTAKQVHELHKWVIGGGRAILLYGVVIARDVHLVGVPHTQKVSLKDWGYYPSVQWAPKEKFDLPALIELMKEEKTWPN